MSQNVCLPGSGYASSTCIVEDRRRGYIFPSRRRTSLPALTVFQYYEKHPPTKIPLFEVPLNPSLTRSVYTKGGLS